MLLTIVQENNLHHILDYWHIFKISRIFVWATFVPVTPALLFNQRAIMSKGSYIFQKCIDHLWILGARKMTWNKFVTEDPIVLEWPLNCFLEFYSLYLWNCYIFVVKTGAENIRFDRTEYAIRDSRSFVFELEYRGRVPSQINP